MGARARGAVLGGLIAAACVVPPAVAGAAPPDVIRTGGPSEPSDAKRAVVLSEERLAGESFTVTSSSGRVVLRGRLRTATGSARPWRHAAVADLSAVRTPGTYRIRAAGRTASRRWIVLADGAAGSQSIRHVLRFFAMNADGSEPSPVHGPSHMNDATIGGQRVDLTGGWMDAGDTLKFTGTTAYSVVSLLLAARLSPSDAAPLVDAAGVGVRWLLKAHPAPGVFVSQVGELRADHDRDPTEGYDPADDDESSISALSHRTALTGIGYDSGGRAAAALALAAQFEPDPARKAQLLAAAREWYVAGEAKGGLAPRLPEDPYPSSSGIDDMALGAIELYRAGGEAQDLADAIDWLDGAEPAEPTTWDAVAPLAAADLCGAAGLPAPSPQAAAAGCAFVRDANRHAARRARAHALGTVGVLSFGTTAMHGGAGAVLALGGQTALAADARDWMLGRNPWGASFVAGLGPAAPRSVHHWTARRGASAFRGAVVGGPTTRAVLREQELRYRPNRFDGPAGVYEDRGADYVTSEVAIDYAASAVLLFAAVSAR
jgi:hypothetical protein